MKNVPIIDAASQVVRANLGGQSCRIQIRQTTAGGVFIDLYVDELPIVVGVACQNRNRIVRDAYLGFTGDLAMVDTLGESDPQTPGLGTQFQLFYLEAADLGGQA